MPPWGTPGMVWDIIKVHRSVRDTITGEYRYGLNGVVRVAGVIILKGKMAIPVIMHMRKLCIGVSNGLVSAKCIIKLAVDCKSWFYAQVVSVGEF